LFCIQTPVLHTPLRTRERPHRTIAVFDRLAHPPATRYARFGHVYAERGGVR